MNLDELPGNNIFKVRDLVYSKSRGLGRVIYMYYDQPVVVFYGGRLRIDLNEEELSIVPVGLLSPSKRPVLYVDGKKESGASLVRQRKNDFISISRLANVLGMTSKKLVSKLEEMGFKVHRFGNRMMVARQDITQIEKSVLR